ncbi:hypothetical protein BM221_010760 [Beauveria bassiana]|uniref:Uncharacterized protein n=1 Tax=Beauveria bassiana TaxID=176275 RepID=A0A2N6N7Z9_BEABA|nr:hypothetical protein BM221_010760 [Beauveria bassiana]
MAGANRHFEYPIDTAAALRLRPDSRMLLTSEPGVQLGVQLGVVASSWYGILTTKPSCPASQAKDQTHQLAPPPRFGDMI